MKLIISIVGQKHAFDIFGCVFGVPYTFVHLQGHNVLVIASCECQLSSISAVYFAFCRNIPFISCPFNSRVAKIEQV